MSSSISGKLWAYVRERFPLWLALLLPLLLTLAALRQKVMAPLEFATAFAMALLLVFELRLLDDLFDVEPDRREHPDRVLCGAASLKPFVGLLVVVGIVNFALVLWLRPWWGAALLLVLHLLLIAWYICRSLFPSPGANYHVVLLKYPLIVVILGANTQNDLASPPLLSSAVMVYLALCIYEVIHDGKLRALRGARLCLAVECLLLAVIGCLALMSAASQWRPL